MFPPNIPSHSQHLQYGAAAPSPAEPSSANQRALQQAPGGTVSTQLSLAIGAPQQSEAANQQVPGDTHMR